MNKKNRKKGGRIGEIERELKELKEERRKIMETVKGEGQVQLVKRVKNKIEKKRRRRRELILREKIDELEVCYQARDTRKYWNKLKVGGWKRKGGGRIPETAVDEEGK